MDEYIGYWCLVLHAHLPFVRHPEYEDFLEEDWFYEGVIETYIPLLYIFEKLLEEKIDYRVTISISPTLSAMMSDQLLQNRCYKKLNNLIEFTEKELIRTKNIPEFHHTARMYNQKLKLYKDIYEKYNKNLLVGFKKLQDAGKIEIITCAATHGFLPFMKYKNSQRAQIKIAVDEYTKVFGRKPNGIWLPECAYCAGLENILKEFGIKYFFLEAHGILYGTPRPKYGVFSPVYCPNKVAVFGRDMETAHQVWSADIGYPGDFDYREFYRDAGYDLEYEYVKPYLHNDGVRRNIGIKYYRITGKVALSEKQPYNIEWALNKASIHAGNFMFNREQQIKFLYNYFSHKKPIVVSPYDAELYGHWWYEGIDFINFLLRKIYYDQKILKTITPSEYLEKYPNNQIITPAESSWGDKGYFEVWLNGTNDWIYKHLHKMEERMIELANENKNTQDLLKIRVLNQMARELLLAQASDWAFIMTTQTMVEYAHKRTKDHILRFTNFYYQIKQNKLDQHYLSEIESKDNIFPDIDFKIYAQQD